MDLFSQELLPLKLISDRGSSFTSGLMKSSSRLLGFELATTVAYRANENGQAKRSHSFLHAFLSVLLSNDHKTDCDQCLGIISPSYRPCVHPALDEAPFFMEKRS